MTLVATVVRIRPQPVRGFAQYLRAGRDFIDYIDEMTPYLGELEQLVLLVTMQLNENAYGVTIRRLLHERTGRDAAMATIYTTLDRLEEKGCVSTRFGEPTAERGGRRKRYSRVTATGQRALRDSLATLRALTAGLGKDFKL
jgi:PadR family transcriptional regulator PadR